jgi:hypothetical protein
MMVLAAMAMKCLVIWDVMPCSPLKINRRFGGTCNFLLQGRRISQARDQSKSEWQTEQGMFLRRVA